MTEALFSTPAMAAAFAPAAHVRAMLAFEAALARAQAACGAIPPAAAEAIATACAAAQIDVAALYAEAAQAGTPAIPLVRMLAAQVGGEHGGYAHWGATSQDALDTALALQMRAGLDLLLADLQAICGRCAALAEQHRGTLMAGRTLLQHALPITFGLKAARWLDMTMRQLAALRAQRGQLAAQCGGAVGTLAALGIHGPAVAAQLAAELGLAPPGLPWHAERDRVASLAAALGVAAGALAKIAHDIVLLAQSELGEVSEAASPGKGGSSAMPQKRNPVDATFALAAAQLAQRQAAGLLAAPPPEHERAAGAWQAEWQAIPALFCALAGAAARVRSALAGLQVDAARMRANLDAGGGLAMAEALAMALAPQLGRPAAHELVKALAARAQAGATLLQLALAEPQVTATLSPAAIAAALDPAEYLGSSSLWIDRALAAYRAL